MNSENVFFILVIVMMLAFSYAGSGEQQEPAPEPAPTSSEAAPEQQADDAGTKLNILAWLAGGVVSAFGISCLAGLLLVIDLMPFSGASRSSDREDRREF